MTPFYYLLEKLHRGKNPYTNFPTDQWAGTWYSDPGATSEIFKTAIERAKPGIVIEVGSFVGESALFMAGYMKSRRMNAAILCVDSWYAGFDHFKGAPEKLQMHYGRSDLYYKFLANVIQRGGQDMILPFAIDSVNGARVLKWMGIQADFLYSDASHEQGDVLQCYEGYWELLKPGGVMLVDDLSSHFPGVLHDFDAFVAAHKLKPERDGAKAFVVKP